jgi:type IV pilus assembly protein PilQ
LTSVSAWRVERQKIKGKIMARPNRHRNFLQTILTGGAILFAYVAMLQPAAAAFQTPPQNPPPPAPTPTSRPPRIAPSQGSQNAPGTQYGQPGFVGEPINLNVVNADIRDILNYITENYGVNFVVDSSVGKVPVTVNVTNVPWNIALDSILKANGLGVEVTGNILRVATAQTLAAEAKVQAAIKESQLDNSPLVTEIIRLNYARASGTLTSQAGGTDQFAGAQPSFVAVSGSEQRAIGTNLGGGQIQGGGLLQIIRRRLSRRGGIEVDERSNTLIVTDVRQNVDAIRRLVELLDQPEPQVEIETRIVIANRSFSRDLGVQLNALAINTTTGGTIGYQTAQGSPTTGATGGSTNTIGLRPSGIPQGILNPSTAVGLGANNPSTIIGLTTGVIGTAQISALITAAESKGLAKVVATPRVTALNNRPAQIETGSQIPVVTPQTGAGGTGGALIFTTTYVSVPLRLSVTPQITDAGTVLMHVTAENNSINTSIANAGTPGIDTQRMQTDVLVPDGGTTVVGGALLDNESNLENRTPGLGTLPVVGNLFKRKAVSRQTNEILFFITPRIYRPDYMGRPTSGTVGTGTRTVQIPQPVPLGNPPSNSSEQNTQPQPRPETSAPANPAPMNPVAPVERP